MEELVALQHAGDPERTSRRVVQLRAMLDVGLASSGTATARASAPSIALFAAEAPAEQQDGDALPSVPDWIELIPAPLEEAGTGHVEVRDWRPGFVIHNPQDLVDKFNAVPAERRALVLDWEHKSHRNWSGDRNPAAGWIEELEVRSSAIWGRIVWTPEGRDDVRLRRYRYVSPVVSLLWPADSEGHIDWDAIPEATELVDAALTNCPATYIRDLASTPDENAVDIMPGLHSQAPSPARSPEQPPPQPVPRAEQEDTMKLSTETLTALGLSDNATEAQINEAIQASINSKLTAESDVNARFAKIEAQLAEKDAKIEALSAGTGEATRAAEKAQVAAVLSECSDRFVPAERELLEQLGIEKGADYIRQMLASRPSLKHLQTEAPPHGSADANTVRLTDDEKLVCTNLGLQPEEFLASKQALQSTAA